ncbi:MAG: anaerobic ribonucleoside-triphosphate reductase activating protein [Paludibacteraceae bacterium]|nr:anaerobic ribonucleoside-triphosphate reductase activating protein [Paludibacteraceae bacterium]
MMKFASYDIVFQEVPGEVTLAVNITGCPNRCPGCHSPHLWADDGIELDKQALTGLLADYGRGVTCVALMGGDATLGEVYELAQWIKQQGYKSAWYSGRDKLPGDCPTGRFDYIKVGPYIEHLGGLKSPTTNQRMYHVAADGTLEDITYKLQTHR